MYLTGGIVLLIIGVAMIWLARPNKEGQHAAPFRGDFIRVIWPALCLAILVAGIAGIVRGLGLA